MDRNTVLLCFLYKGAGYAGIPDNVQGKNQIAGNLVMGFTILEHANITVPKTQLVVDVFLGKNSDDAFFFEIG
jgi:hypothetical protein